MLGEVGSSSALEVIFTFLLANTLSLDSSLWLVYAHSMIEINLSVLVMYVVCIRIHDVPFLKSLSGVFM